MSRWILSVWSTRRQFNSTWSRMQRMNSFEEIKIPVPCGHIAGKWWGPRDCQPVLAAHGYLDNAATFDRLVPLLKAKSVLCIDLPGHGLSSHHCPGIFPRSQDIILVIRYIINVHFGWKNLTLLGHSYGSSLFYSYAAMFPEEVERLISVECTRLWGTYDIEETVKHNRDYQEIAIKDYKDNYSEEMSWEGLITKMVDRRKGLGLSLKRSSCEILARRNTTRTGEDKFRLTFDKRFTSSTYLPRPYNVIIREAARIAADVLHVNGSHGVIGSNIDGKLWQKNLEEMKNCKIINVQVSGGHHVHLDDPEQVATPINDFLSK